jgi:NADPH:quinone reductase-like Zn-dependent oxidoreductase
MLAGVLGNTLRSAFTRRKMPGLLAKINRDDLAILSSLVQTGTVVPIVDRTYALHEAAEAICHVESGHTHGKVVIAVTSAL